MKNIAVILVFALLISAIILFPLAVIWALNTLFSLGIPYSFWTWLAVCVINLTWARKTVSIENLKNVKLKGE